jgi:atypical dual specificity phosphatase
MLCDVALGKRVERRKPVGAAADRNLSGGERMTIVGRLLGALGTTRFARSKDTPAHGGVDEADAHRADAHRVDPGRQLSGVDPTSGSASPNIDSGLAQADRLLVRPLNENGETATVVRLPERASPKATEESLLVSTGFGVSFGAKVVLAEVDLTLPTRGATVLMGPVGTGKSTLLRSFTDFFSKNSLYRSWGTVSYRGAPLSPDNQPALVQQHLVMTRDSVLDSLTFHIRRQKRISIEARRKWAETWLERIAVSDLNEFFDRSFMDLEPANQRKVAILREAAAGPALLMIDEPTRGLSEADALSVLELIEVLARYMSILVTLHNQKQARLIGQNIILLAGGRVQEQSEPDKFFEKSRNECVRQFARTGSCAVPAPDMPPEFLGEGVAPPPPLPLAAIEATKRFASDRRADAASFESASASLHWLDALPTRRTSEAKGPPGFVWVVEGRLAGAPLPGSVNDIDYDLCLLKKAGVTTLVTLTESDLQSAALTAHGLDNLHLAIADGGVPSLLDAQALLLRMRKLLEAGKVLAVHCLEGVGRTGTILAACLMEGKGMTAQEALAQLRALRPGFVKTAEQEIFLVAYEEAVSSRL